MVYKVRDVLSRIQTTGRKEYRIRMSRQEFLTELEAALRGELPEREVAGHIAYYREYIEEQIRQGKRESQVMDMLGDPRLIARTILETSDQKQTYESQDYFYEQREQEDQEELQKAAAALKRKHIIRVVIGIFIGLAILTFVVRLLTFLIPIVVPIILILILVSYFKRR